MTKAEFEAQRAKALELYEKAAIVLTEEEKAAMEIIDFRLDKVNEIGLQLIVYINTQRVCAKEMVLLPGQTCPEHIHVPSYGQPGKEETFRCRWGEVYLYVEGEGNKEDIKATLPDMETSVYHEIILKPGQQYTILPETKHWFQGGPQGAVISEFSTRSTDETDTFTDKRLVRETKIEE